MSIRRVLRFLAWVGMVMLFCLGPWNGCSPDEHEFRQAATLVANASTLKSTTVSATLETPIATQTNVMWCATFQLAWNECCKLAGGPLRFRPPQNALVDSLNRRTVTGDDLDAASYVAIAGYVRDGIFARIDQVLRDKFHGAAKPTLLPDPRAASRPQDIVAYCYLFKQLDFPIPFERLDTPLHFGQTDVQSFGFGPYKPGCAEMSREVSIIDYRSPDDFVIELQTKSSKDHLVLAKIAPQATLAQTVEQARQRIATGKPAPAAPVDVLRIPKMNFDITRSYHEITGKTLVPTAPGMADDLTLLVADQNIRFLMDEKGVQLKSEAHMEFGCGRETPPLPEHMLVFDKPFLLLLSRDGAKTPYFAMWIGNSDLLEGDRQKPPP